MGTVELATMQDYDPKETYDLITFNWCLGYVGDEDAVKVLRKFKAKLRSPDKTKTRATDSRAFIVVVDNMRDSQVYDEDKQRIQRLRSPETLEELFAKAGLMIHGEPVEADLGKDALKIKAWTLH